MIESNHLIIEHSIKEFLIFHTDTDDNIIKRSVYEKLKRLFSNLMEYPIILNSFEFDFSKAYKSVNGFLVIPIEIRILYSIQTDQTEKNNRSKIIKEIENNFRCKTFHELRNAFEHKIIFRTITTDRLEKTIDCSQMRNGKKSFELSLFWDSLEETLKQSQPSNLTCERESNSFKYNIIVKQVKQSKHYNNITEER